MPADVFVSQYDDPEQGLLEWHLLKDRVEWASRQFAMSPVDGE